MGIAREEIFGPVLSVIPFKDADEGIALGNETFYGLAAAVWTRDVAKALRAARAIRAGTVWGQRLQPLRRRPALRWLQGVGLRP
jgi:acyl-CoA reductase-like NAD-dependent aldehyde dehydrogenase